jgi:hypothetical protein
MKSLGAQMLFLHGHIADPALARRLAAVSAPSAPPPERRRHSLRRLLALWSLWLVR